MAFLLLMVMNNGITTVYLSYLFHFLSSLLIHVLGGDLVIDTATDGNLEVGLVNLEDWFRFRKVEKTLTKSGLLTGGDEM